MSRARSRLAIGSKALIGLLSLVLLGAGEPLKADDFATDARSIETLVNANYAYLERLPGGRFALSPKLSAEAGAVKDVRGLIRFSERALALLADHHAITGSSRSDSWSLFPSYGDLWIERQDGRFVITAVRPSSPAAAAGVSRGDVLHAVDSKATAAAVAAFWSDLGVTGGGERDDYAARILAAGRRDRPRKLTIGSPLARPRDLELPNLNSLALADRPVLSARQEKGALVIQVHDSLGSDATITAFDLWMARARPGQPIVIDLTDTPGGGNTIVARAILGWFVTRPAFYQVHSLPGEERRTGIARQWVEQVLPRAGKHHRGPVTVRVGHWTGSMGEGLAIGFDAIGQRVEGTPMAGLLGAIYDHRLERSGQILKIPTERLSSVNGKPREQFVPHALPRR